MKTELPPQSLSPMRIAIGCASICVSRGGSERAATRLANYLTGRGHSVTLLSLRYDDNQGVPAYPLDKRVQHWNLRFSEKHSDIKKYRNLLIAENVDVFVSMQSCTIHLFWSMVCMGSGIPFICSERSSPNDYVAFTGWNSVGRNALLSGADCIHELLPTYLETLPAWCRDRGIVIPNVAPERQAHIRCARQATSDKPNILLYLSRFSRPKLPDMLITAFETLAQDIPNWELHLYGHGALEKSLHAQIAKSPWKSRIIMHGTSTDTERAYAEADIFCMPTSFEGFPNVVLEAMNAGLPVVGFRDCEGVRGVVRDGETGCLADSISAAALAQALRPLMDDAPLRQRMGQAAQQECWKKYKASTIHERWEKLFYAMAQRKGNTVMDSFFAEPFASKARLSAVARREWLFRNFGDPLPWSSTWLWQRIVCFFKNIKADQTNKH